MSGSRESRHPHLDHLEQFLRTIYTTNAQRVEELDCERKSVMKVARLSDVHTHKSRETLERAGDADMRVDLNEDALSSMDVNLEKTSFVEWGVEKS